jgi:hypothetical protein
MMRRTPIKRGTKGMRRSDMARAGSGTRTQERKAAPSSKAKLKTKRRSVTDAERRYWDRLASVIGCVACLRARRPSDSPVSIHHIDGRTKPGCHMLVLPLCAGCHQQGTGNDKSLVAVHGNKARFEKLYGTQLELKALCDAMLEWCGPNGR